MKTIVVLIVCVVLSGFMACHVWRTTAEWRYDRQTLREFHRRFDPQTRGLIEEFKARGLDTHDVEEFCLHPDSVDDLPYCEVAMRNLAAKIQ